MKIILGVLLTMLSASITQAQSIDQTFAQLNKLANKAKGEKYEKQEIFTVNPIKVGQQNLSQQLVTVHEKFNGDNDKTEWVSHYTMIPWDKVKDYRVKDYNMLANGKGYKIFILLFNFDETLKLSHYPLDKPDQIKKPYSKSMMMYFRNEDWKKVKELTDKIMDHFHK